MKDLVGRLASIIEVAVDASPFEPGCSESQVSDLEKLLGLSLPQDFRAFLRNANGQSDPHRLGFPPDQLNFLGVAEIATLWKELLDKQDDEFMDELTFDDKVRWILFHPRRVPIAHNEIAGTYLFLDFIPGPEGHDGQLVFNVNEVDCVVVEDSVTALLDRYLTALQTGTMTLEPKPREHGDGYWFTVDGRYIDYEVYQELKGSVIDQD
jgi:cell wall assembly regulator SMI1